MALLQNNQVKPYDRKGQPAYRFQEYPKHLPVPGMVQDGSPGSFVEVNSDVEEEAQRAKWQMETHSSEGGSYPMWLFHTTQAPVMVRSKAEADAKGLGWYRTPGEAAEAATAHAKRPAAPSKPVHEDADDFVAVQAPVIEPVNAALTSKGQLSPERLNQLNAPVEHHLQAETGHLTSKPEAPLPDDFDAAAQAFDDLPTEKANAKASGKGAKKA